jgi:hypothetical protein
LKIFASFFLAIRLVRKILISFALSTTANRIATGKAILGFDCRVV